LIPTLSLSDIEAESPEAIERLRRAGRDIGVFYLDAGDRLARRFFADLFEQSRQFFRLPLDPKQALALANSSNFRGYVGMGEEYTRGQADIKESFEFAQETRVPASDNPPPYFRLYGENQWPDASRLPRFRPTLGEYSEWMDRIGRVVLKGMALTLGQPVTPEAGGGLFRGDPCFFSRLIYYGNPLDFGETDTRLGAHTDHVLFTLTLQDAPGLEVQTNAGEWIRVEPSEELFVVFPGELMEFWTRGYYKATTHRVHNKALRTERLSVASFFLPDLQSEVAPIDPASSPHLADVDLSMSSDNSWLTKPQAEAQANGASAGELLRPIMIGEKEWERVNAIFPDEAAPAEESAQETS
jgi:isopenicillin N synthase-like dioxygenase